MTEEIESEKHYYSIGEVAKMFNLSISNIRFWEQEFEILKPKKNKKGDRFFTKQDVSNLKVIYHLLKEKGYTIEGARKKLSRVVLSLSEMQGNLLPSNIFLPPFCLFYSMWRLSFCIRGQLILLSLEHMA